MSDRYQAQPAAEVPPLELFFDLVFVFAVSQLTHHLVEHTDGRGAIETVTLLVAVFGVWSYTSWGSTLPGIPRATHQWTVLAVMVVGLFMNAAISEAFSSQPFFFVVPYLVCRIGPPIYWRVVSDDIVNHYSAMLVWFGAAAVLWITGAASSPDHRLGWWATAALVEISGTWLAHPVPGHRFHTSEVAVAPGRMLERSRLFLLIALGEVILSTGTAVAARPFSASTITTAALSMLSIIALWALYFGGSDRLIAEKAATTPDPLRAARLAINTQVLVLAGLIALAVANELAIAEPTGNPTAAMVLLMFGGPALYLAVQTWYLHAVTTHTSRRRLVAIAGLAIGAATASLTMPIVAAAILCATLLALVSSLLTEPEADPARPDRES